MKRLSILLLTVFLGYMPLFGFQFDFSLEDIPMMVLGMDTNDSSYYSFYNIANVGLKFYFEDQSFLKFRLKDTYFDFYKTNTLYVDRLSYTYNSDSFNLLAGRDYYVEGDGILIGNLADGLNLDLNLLGFSERLYVYYSGAYYSGFLPIEINQFDMTYSDLILSNGPDRLFGGLELEKKGLGLESIGAVVLYSQDMSTNNSYNPIYFGINAKTSIIDSLVLSGNILGEAGNYTPSNSILAFGGNLGVYYLSGGDFKYGFIAKVSAATGNDNTNTNSGQSYGQFDTFGQYNTGIILQPKLANMIMAQGGVLLKVLGDHLTLSVNYYYFTRMTTNDSVNGYYDGSGYSIGHEISGSVIYDIDPDFTIFITGGYFIKGDAFTDETNRFELIGGVSVHI